MAIAGDVVIRLAADFATFAADMDQSVRKLEEFGRATQQTNTKIEGFIGQIRGAAIVAATLWAGREMVRWGQDTAKAAAETEALAKKLGFTADQIEAMQRSAKATGQTFDEQAKYFRSNRRELDEMTEAMRAQGALMAGPTRAAFADINAELENFGRTISTVRQQFQGGAVDTVASTIARMIRDMGASLAYFETYAGTIRSVRELFTIFTGAGGLVGVPAAERAQQQLDRLRATAVEAEVALQKAEQALQRQRGVAEGTGDALARQREAILRGQGASPGAALADLEANAAKARQIRDAAVAAAGQAEAAIAKAEKALATAREDPARRVPTAPAGGGGRTDADNIEAQIRRYDALGEAARNAYATIERNQGAYLEDLQRAVKVNQQVEEVVGKLAAKYFELTAAQREQLRVSVDAALREDERVRKRLDAEAKADELERRLGDGRAARERARREREDMAETRRASPEALTRAMKQQEEQISLTALEARRYDDTLGSLSAGFEAAAERYARANDLFTSGAGAFDALTTAMSESLQVLVGRSDKSFGEIAASFANMLADMALRAAVSQAFKYIGAAIGGGTGGGSGWTYAAPPTEGRAYGGPVDPFRPYTVGERGPERFVPFVPGQIEPADRSGVTVSLGDTVITTTNGSNVDPGQAVELGRRIKAAVIEVVTDQKRPGGVLYSRAST